MFLLKRFHSVLIQYPVYLLSNTVCKSTEFLSRETHRNSIVLSRVDFKLYCLLSEMFYILYYISMQDFCLEKPIGITLSCLEWILNYNTYFLVQIFANFTNTSNVLLSGVDFCQISLNLSHTSTDSVLSNNPVPTCFLLSILLSLAFFTVFLLI